VGAAVWVVREDALAVAARSGAIDRGGFAAAYSPMRIAFLFAAASTCKARRTFV
jgi:hypothetical protein